MAAHNFMNSGLALPLYSHTPEEGPLMIQLQAIRGLRSPCFGLGGDFFQRGHDELFSPLARSAAHFALVRLQASCCFLSIVDPKIGIWWLG